MAYIATGLEQQSETSQKQLYFYQLTPLKFNPKTSTDHSAQIAASPRFSPLNALTSFRIRDSLRFDGTLFQATRQKTSVKGIKCSKQCFLTFLCHGCGYRIGEI